MTNIYFWGKNISPSFLKQYQKNIRGVKSLHCDQIIKEVQCGAQNGFILTQKNQLYGFGSNEEGQMGLCYNPHKNLQISRIFVPTKKRITSISCGWYHTLVLDQTGDLFSTGDGSEGAIGDGTRQNSYGFKLVMKNVEKISAGRDHSLVIKGNKVFGWGNTQQGQLGLHTKKRYISPQELNVYPSKEVFAGAKYSIFVTVKGVYGCGINDKYQLGLGHQKDLHYPKKLNFEEQIQKVWGGNYCLALNNKNKMYIWGTSAFGTYKYPTKMQLFQGCQNVSLGHNFGLASKRQRIFVWGSNRYGQLAIQSIDSKDYAYQCHYLSKLDLVKFSCGSNFTLGISYKQPKQIKQNRRDVNARDQIVEDDDSGDSFSDQNDHKNSKSSFYSSFQRSPKCFQNLPKPQERSITKNDKNKQFAVYSIHRNKQSPLLKHNSSISQNAKSISHETVKIMSSNSIFNKQNKANGQSDMVKYKIKGQLSQLKVKVQEKNAKNRLLTQQNQSLKQILKQQLLKQALSQEKLKLQQNYHNSQKGKYKSKINQFDLLKSQYQAVNNLINNDFSLKGGVGLQCKQNQKGQIAQGQVQNFGQRLTRLKRIMQEMINQSQSERSQKSLKH